jgi:hypothetical protein
MNNKTANKLRKNPNDVIYTPEPLAKDMIKICKIKKGETVLDPSKGAGVFYNNFPKNCKKDYCEITESKDFFEYNKKVDWVIGNPPYSLWDKWLDHTMEITDKFCYIFSVFNLTPKRLNKMEEKGFGVTKFYFLRVAWWFGPSFVIVAERNKKSILNNFGKTYNCDICNSNCKRGCTYKGKKYGMNECSKKAEL